MDEPTPAAGLLPPPQAPSTAGIALGEERRLDPRSLVLARWGGAVRALLLGAAVAVGLLIAAVGLIPPRTAFWMFLGWVAVFPAVLWLLAWRLPRLRYERASYRVDAGGIEIRRGVLWREIVSVPRNRVQHTDVSQGPIERSLGLGTLVIFTAGSVHASVHLDGIAHGTAFAIRDHLLGGGADDGV